MGLSSPKKNGGPDSKRAARTSIPFPSNRNTSCPRNSTSIYIVFLLFFHLCMVLHRMHPHAPACTRVPRVPNGWQEEILNETPDFAEFPMVADMAPRPPSSGGFERRGGMMWRHPESNEPMPH